MKYNGTADGRTAFIILVRFVVEYAFSQVKYAGQITADINGVVDDGSGTISGTPALLLERPDHVFSWSLIKGLSLAASTVDATTFNAAGVNLAAAIAGGYKFAGLLNKKQAARAWWGEWGKESRTVMSFDRGAARLFYRPLDFADSGLPNTRRLTKADIAVNETSEGAISTLKLDRSRVEDVVNSIGLKFARDFVADDYSSITSITDPDSITRYGVREVEDNFLFNWVRLAPMAESVRDFYLSELKEPSQYGTFDAVLQHIDLERFDWLSLSHPILGQGEGFEFPALMVGPSRQIGNGRNRKADLMRFTVRFDGSTNQFIFPVTPAPADMVFDTVNPVVLIVSVVTPAPADMVFDTVNPVVVKGSLVTLTTPADMVFDAVDPVVRIDGSITVTPAPADMVFDTVNPTVFTGFPVITANPANIVFDTVNPVVVLSSITVTPAPADMVFDTVDPVVVKGSLVVLTAPADIVLDAKIGWVKPSTWNTAVGTLNENPNTWNNS